MSDARSTEVRLGRLGRRILLAFLVVAVVPLVLTTLLSHWRNVALVEDYVAENVGKTARAYAADLDRFLDQRQRRLRELRLDGEADPSAVLRAAVAADATLSNLALIDAGGQVIAASEDPLDPWAADACARLAPAGVSPMKHAGADHDHEVVVAVLVDQGVLCGQVTFTLHQDMLTERARSVAGGTAYIVDRSGTVVCHAFEESEPHVHRGDTLTGLAADVASAGVPWAGPLRDSDRPAFAAYAPASRLPWGVWVEVPRDAAVGPLWAGLRGTLLYGALFAFAACLVAVILVRRIVSPIQRVAEAVRTIGGGQYGAQVQVRGEDEVAGLARDVNRMSDALAASYAELDERVQERTAELQAARDFSDLLLDTMQERILVIDRDLTVTRANDAALDAYGAEIVGCGCKTVHALGGGDGAPCPAARVLESGQPEHEERALRREGRTEILAVDTYPILGEDGAPRGVVEIARDVTDVKQMYARLAHQEKMASVGTLAAGLAHEIGNPLASMSSELEMLEMDWDAEGARRSLPVLRSQVRRISSLLRELMEYGRAPTDDTTVFDPRRVLEEVARLLRHDPRSQGVEIRVHAAPDADQLCTNRDRLVQVLVNLGLNGIDACESEGAVHLGVARVDGTVRISVADDGPGVPPDVAAKVFDPFFTTKAPGRGTGLGLFVSERIVEGLGGRMTLIPSGKRTGAEFVVELPECACGSHRRPANG